MILEEKQLPFSKGYIDFFDNVLVNSESGVEITDYSPMEIIIDTEDAVLYSTINKAFVDYSPKTLGYYWIEKDKCLRTKKGLVFKNVEEGEPYVQSRYLGEGELQNQALDLDKSIKPESEVEFTFSNLYGKKAVLFYNSPFQWSLIVNNQIMRIIISEFDFTLLKVIKAYKIKNNQLFWQDKPLFTSRLQKSSDMPNDCKTSNDFEILSLNYCIYKGHVYYRNNIIDQANAESAKVQIVDYLIDETHVFLHGSKVDVDRPI